MLNRIIVLVRFPFSEHGRQLYSISAATVIAFNYYTAYVVQSCKPSPIAYIDQSHALLSLCSRQLTCKMLFSDIPQDDLKFWTMI